MAEPSAAWLRRRAAVSNGFPPNPQSAKLALLFPDVTATWVCAGSRLSIRALGCGPAAGWVDGAGGAAPSASSPQHECDVKATDEALRGLLRQQGPRGESQAKTPVNWVLSPGGLAQRLGGFSGGRGWANQGAPRPSTPWPAPARLLLPLVAPALVRLNCGPPSPSQTLAGNSAARKPGACLPNR